MWDYVPILIGVFGASMVVGIYWKLKKDTIDYAKLLRIALCVAFFLSLLSVGRVHLRSGAPLILFWIAEFVLDLVIVRQGTQLKKTYNEFRLDPRRYLESRTMRICEALRPFFDVLAPKGSWKDVRVGKIVRPNGFQIFLVVTAIVLVAVASLIAMFLFFNEEQQMRPIVWLVRYSLLFLAVRLTAGYVLIFALLMLARWLSVLRSPLQFKESFSCIVEYSGYGAAFASCIVLILPVIFLLFGKRLNSVDGPPFSLSLLFSAASVGALIGLVIGSFAGLFRLVYSRNLFYNSIIPSILFGIVDLGFLYGYCNLRPSILLNRYLESHLIQGVDTCDNVEAAESILRECLSWNCERFFAVVNMCDPSMGRLIDSVDVIYFRAVLSCLVCCVLWRLVRSIRRAKGGLPEDVVSSA
jgi:hypothetical protein